VPTMTPEQWRDMINIESPTVFHTPPEYQGQTVTRSYAQKEEYIFERIDDASDGSVVIKVYLGTEGVFEPWDRPPALGELMWKERLS